MSATKLPSLVDELDLAVAAAPDRPFVRMRTGELTFSQFDARTNQLANAFVSLGVKAGDRVSVLLPNCVEAVTIWFGLAKIGAVSAPVNSSLKGATLLRVLHVAASEILIVHQSLVSQMLEIETDLKTIRQILIVDDSSANSNSNTASRTSFADLVNAAAITRPEQERPSGADLTLLLYTSGTTGGSKAVMVSHRFAIVQGKLMIEGLRLNDRDVLYCPYPLFHIDATVLTIVPALLLRGVAAIGERFSASKYWDEVRALGATVFDFMGATITMLWKQPPTPRDHEHAARLGWGVPLPAWAPQFEERFGCRLVELYGLTETGVIMYTPLDEPRRPGSCGKLLGPYDAQIVDEQGFELPSGKVGELVVRPLEPNVMMEGYFGMPSDSLMAFRNLWFHTGDMLKRDSEGFFYFVGRLKDVVRRRGENISSVEVERVINEHPDIVESCVFGVPSELSEEEVMACIVTRSGVTPNGLSLHQFCARKMARFMVPRYFRFVERFPKTPTDKIEKHLMQKEGITPDTWDAASTDGGGGAIDRARVQ